MAPIKGKTAMPSENKTNGTDSPRKGVLAFSRVIYKN